ncbi:MAG: hypothetical protein AAF432_06220, partial [Planctomycetota bacterium]
VNETLCDDIGGIFQGLFTACSTSNCEPPNGACCFDSGECQSLQQIACVDGGGTYQGDFTGCAAAECPMAGDVNGSGAVTVDDILAVINAFGAVCVPTPCPEDVNDSGVVNIDDILAVINAFAA